MSSNNHAHTKHMTNPTTAYVCRRTRWLSVCSCRRRIWCYWRHPWVLSVWKPEGVHIPGWESNFATFTVERRRNECVSFGVSVCMYITNAEQMKGFSWNLTLRRFIYCLLSTSFKHIVYYCDYSHPRTPTNAHIYMKSQITHVHEPPNLFQR